MKSLQFFSKISLILFILALSSCDVIELETAPSSNNPSDQGNDPQGDIDGPTTIPNDSDTFDAYLVGDSAKTWSAAAFTLEGISGFQDCRLDDQMILTVDGTYFFDGGSNFCGGEDQAQAAGTYQVSFEDATVNFTLGTESFPGIITGLTEDELVITGSYLGLRIEARYTSQ